MTPLRHDLTALFTHLDPRASVALHAGENVDGARLKRDVAERAAALSQQPERDWAIFHHHGYPALVSLLALWQTGKRAWLPGNNHPATATALSEYCPAFLGDWPASRELPDRGDDYLLIDTDPDVELVIFTSGSSGQPKPIIKPYRYLLNELATLEKAFGHLLGGSQIAGTVSHQHIYGLLFRLLWPLAAGRVTHSEAFQDPAGILRLAASQPLAWVASPAHLKRLRGDLPWQPAHPPTAIFSSGGTLPASSAEHVAHHAGVPVTAIYGSSETGGIGWRHQPDKGEIWKPLPGISLSETEAGIRLHSPHVDPNGVLLDDQLTLLEDQCFRLASRRDRIVKVEEKRISLATVEQALLSFPGVAEARALQPAGEQRLAAVLVLEDAQRQRLAEQGRREMITALRTHLADSLEALAIPRRWRFVAALPESSQGKIPLRELEALFTSSQDHLPEILQEHHETDKVSLTFRIKPSLPWFSGHFLQKGVLPGVVQIDWAEGFGRQYFPLPTCNYRLEAIKFNNLILPTQTLTLTLSWRMDTAKLAFSFQSDRGPHSSGRLAFEEPT